MYKLQKINEQKAIAYWGGKLSEALHVKDPQKLAMLSVLAESKMQLDGPVNTSEKKLMESYGISSTGSILGMGPTLWGSDPGTSPGNQPGAWHRGDYKSGSGDVPTLIMGMSMNVAAYCVGLDVVTTIPVDMPSVTCQFLDAVYAGGSLDKVGPAPIYVEIGGTEIKANFPGWADFAYADNVFVTPASSVPAITAGKALHGLFMGRSLLSGKIIVKVVSLGDVAVASGPVVTFTPDATKYSVAEVMDAAGAITKGSTATAVDGTVRKLTSASAAHVSAVREHLAGFSNSDGVTKTPMDRATTEQGTSNKINLRLWSKTVEMKGEEVQADISRVQLRDLRAYGVDGLAQLYKAAQNQLIQTINDQIIDRMAQLGVMNHAQLLTSQNVNLNLFVGPAGTANKALTSFPGIKEFKDPTGTDRKAEFGNISNAETNSAAENNYTRQRRIYSRILAASSLLGTVGRYSKGDVAIVNSQESAALQDCAGFVAAPMENTIGRTSDLHFIGTIGRNVKVYENPKWTWDDTRVVVGCKGTNETPGVKFLAYDLASSVEIISEHSMAPKISVLSRYEIIDYGFFPESQYLTFCLATDFGAWV